MTQIVKDFAEKYAAALMSFSAENIAAYYQEPLAIYSDQGVQLVDDHKQTVGFWEQGVEPYKKMNIARTTPHVLKEQQLSEKIYTAKIEWVNADDGGNEAGRETNFYILTDVDGELKICGLVLMSK